MALPSKLFRYLAFYSLFFVNSSCGFLQEAILHGTQQPAQPAAEISVAQAPASVSNAPAGEVLFQETGSQGLISSYTCSLDGGAFSSCTSPFAFSGLAAGSHSVVIRGLSSSGAQLQEKTVSWTIDLDLNVYFYAHSGTDGKVQTYSYNKTSGSLSAAGFSQVSGLHLNNLCPSQNGKFMYGAGYDESYLYGWTTASNGVLTPISGMPLTSAGKNQSCVVDPTSSYLYVVLETPGETRNYSISSSTGQIQPLTTQASTVVSAVSPWTSFIDPLGKFLYVGNYTEGKIYGFNRSLTNGSLTAMAGSPFSSLAANSYMTSNAAGNIFFSSAWGVGMKSYTRNLSTGVISAVTTVTGGLTALAIHPTANYILVTDWASKHIMAYSYNPTTAVMTAVSGYPVSLASISFGALTFDPSGRYLYAGKDDGGIQIYSFDSASGAITAVGSAISSGLSSVDGIVWSRPLNQ
ncbi:MAG: lactonase family protein [Bdellovibrionales bacterium]|nr:lactonase family protein [Bdellovibrionales bacterium]